MIELIRKLKPQVVITGMPHFEAITSSAFENLLNTTRELGTRLFLDISNHFELSSLPGSNGVLKYLAGKSLPSHAAVLCGLVKNQVDSLEKGTFIFPSGTNGHYISASKFINANIVTVPTKSETVMQKLVRLTFALEDAKSEQALKQIRQFKKLVLEN
ncbi:hypothetical protein BHE74_00033829 [Ensete ventricosum]|nr:hypothetical protein BHE74_00033829 [Ensete ventricosum]